LLARFTERKSITINSPSSTLHVSSLRREVCREDLLREIFGEWGQVESVSILKQSNDKNMALVKFYSIEDSFRAIAELHNSLLHGRKMQISFTKSRAS
jgi:RNA recognition motif-containing protein